MFFTFLLDRSNYGAIKAAAVRGGNSNDFGPQKLIDDVIDNGGKTNNFYSDGSLPNPWVQLSLNTPVEIMALEITNFGKDVSKYLGRRCPKYLLLK